MKSWPLHPDVELTTQWALVGQRALGAIADFLAPAGVLQSWRHVLLPRQIISMFYILFLFPKKKKGTG